jgi:hypothetical protein
VSDFYIRLIPGDQQWQPSREDAEAAVRYLEGLFSGPQDDVEEVGAEFYDRVTLIDAGENTTRVSCSSCTEEIGVDWLYDLVEANGESFDSLEIRVPCCSAMVELSSLHYDWPVGFARFEVTAMNATRAKYELDDGELAELGSILGHPVTQILAHY